MPVELDLVVASEPISGPESPVEERAANEGVHAEGAGQIVRLLAPAHRNHDGAVRDAVSIKNIDGVSALPGSALLLDMIILRLGAEAGKRQSARLAFGKTGVSFGLRDFHAVDGLAVVIGDGSRFAPDEGVLVENIALVKHRLVFALANPLSRLRATRDDANDAGSARELAEVSFAFGARRHERVHVTCEYVRGLARGTLLSQNNLQVRKIFDFSKRTSSFIIPHIAIFVNSISTKMVRMKRL